MGGHVHGNTLKEPRPSWQKVCLGAASLQLELMAPGLRLALQLHPGARAACRRPTALQGAARQKLDATAAAVEKDLWWRRKLGWSPPLNGSRQKKSDPVGVGPRKHALRKASTQPQQVTARLMMAVAVCRQPRGQQRSMVGVWQAAATGSWRSSTGEHSTSHALHRRRQLCELILEVDNRADNRGGISRLVLRQFRPKLASGLVLVGPCKASRCSSRFFCVVPTAVLYAPSSTVPHRLGRSVLLTEAWRRGGTADLLI
jgi:hypothetical protein